MKNDGEGSFNPVKALRAVCRDPRVTGRTLLVACSLIQRAKVDAGGDDDGVAWPSIATLREETGLGRSTVIRGVNDLEDLGMLTVERAWGKGSRYRWCLNGTSPEVEPVPPRNQTSPGVEPHQSPGETTPVPPGDSKVPKKVLKKVLKKAPREGTQDAGDLERHVDEWNAVAATAGLATVELGRRNAATVRKMRAKLRSRQREQAWSWQRILGELPRLDDFARNGWLTLDWVLKNSDNYTKIVEGNYRRAGTKDRERAMADAGRADEPW